MKNEKSMILRWLRVLGDWNLYREEGTNLFVVREPDGATRDFDTKEEAEKHMLYGFYKDRDPTA